MEQLPHHAADEGTLAPEECGGKDRKQQRVVRQPEPETIESEKWKVESGKCIGRGGAEEVEGEGESEPAEDGRHGIGHAVVAPCSIFAPSESIASMRCRIVLLRPS